MNEITGSTPLALLTVDQFLELTSLKKQQAVRKINEYPTDSVNYVYGIGGLARLLGCSKPTAQKIKDSGSISFMQTGRKIIFDAELVLKEIQNKRSEVKQANKRG